MAKDTDFKDYWGRENTRRVADKLPIDYHGDNFILESDYKKQYMKNVGKAGLKTQQQRMRQDADYVESDYKKSSKAAAPAPKAETKPEPKPKPEAGKPAVKTSTRRRAKSRRPAPAMNVGGKGTVTGARGVPAKEPGGKISMEESKVDYPASKSRVSLEDRKAAPAAAAAPAKKRGKLRRAAGSVVRGIGKAARYVGRTLKDNERKRVTK